MIKRLFQYFINRKEDELIDELINEFVKSKFVLLILVLLITGIAFMLIALLSETFETRKMMILDGLLVALVMAISGAIFDIFGSRDE